LTRALKKKAPRKIGTRAGQGRAALAEAQGARRGMWVEANPVCGFDYRRERKNVPLMEGYFFERSSFTRSFSSLSLIFASLS
jgi:hypothetical protein